MPQSQRVDRKASARRERKCERAGRGTMLVERPAPTLPDAATVTVRPPPGEVTAAQFPPAEEPPKKRRRTTASGADADPEG